MTKMQQARDILAEKESMTEGLAREKRTRHKLERLLARAKEDKASKQRILEAVAFICRARNPVAIAILLKHLSRDNKQFSRPDAWEGDNSILRSEEWKEAVELAGKTIFDLTDVLGCDFDSNVEKAIEYAARTIQ